MATGPRSRDQAGKGGKGWKQLWGHESLCVQLKVSLLSLALKYKGLQAMDVRRGRHVTLGPSKAWGPKTACPCH